MSDSADQPSADAVLDVVERWYHVVAVAALLVYMVWVRVQSHANFVEDGEVFFSGNDPYYHFREVVYIVRNYPATMPFDIWTQFPIGTSVGQFGTLYDQLMATAALIVGLGNPSETTIATVMLFTPPVLGALVALPVYFIGRRLGGRAAGVFGVFVLALLPGQFFRVGLVGFTDHHIAEVFFQTVGVLATMAAVGVAHRRKPVYEQVLDRDWTGLREPVGYSVLAGIAVALYVWTWPPAIMLIGILGVYYLLRLTADFYTGESPEHIAFVGGISMATTGMLTLLTITVGGFETTQYSLLQPLSAFGVAAGSVVLAWLGRRWERSDLDRSLYPVTIAGLVVVGTGLFAVLLPDLFGLIQNNLKRFIGFGVTGRTATIAEAQPMLANAEFFEAVYSQYGLAFFTAIGGALLMLLQAAFSGDRHPEHALVLVWAAFITSAAFTQVRFNYYLAAVVAVLTAYLLGWTLRLDFFGAVEGIDDLTASHVFVVLTIVLVVVAPLGVTTAAGSTSFQPQVQAFGSNTGPGPSVVTWDDTLEWMADNTPEEGNYGDAGNAGQLDVYGTYPRQADFDYPPGAYGVMSWWDYGHWITTQAERIPNANPFQAGAPTAANFLLAPNESDANAVLEELDEDDAETRYVLVDWQMAAPFSKFGAPTVFYDRNGQSISRRDFTNPVYTQTQRGFRVLFYHRSQRYYESQMIRLYEFHGSAVDPAPVVVDWENRRVQTGDGRTASIRTQPGGQGSQFGGVVRTFDNMSAAEEFADAETTRSVGGVGRFPQERVPALEHYRLVKYNNLSAFNAGTSYRTNYRVTGQVTRRSAGIRTQQLWHTFPSWVKLFERVPGATVVGEGPANETVLAQVRMRVPSTGENFTYRQYAETGPDGQFEMTLPYSTTGYEKWGTEEGYTDVAVRATSNYTIVTQDRGIRIVDGETVAGPTGTAQFDVPERKVIGEDEAPIEVELTDPFVEDESESSG